MADEQTPSDDLTATLTDAIAKLATDAASESQSAYARDRAEAAERLANTLAIVRQRQRTGRAASA